MKKYAIGLDFGTSSIKGMLLSENEEVIAKGSVSTVYGENSHPDGAKYISLDAEELYLNMCRLIRELRSKLPEDGKITAMTFACASGNTLLCDKDGQPLLPAYSWLNPAYTDECTEVYGYIDKEEARALSGWGFSGTFPLGHLAHIKIHNPELFGSAEFVCMTGEYINHRLTGKWGLDTSTAVPFFLAEMQTRSYHKPYLDALGITEDMLPPLMQTGDLLGYVTEEAAAETGLDAGTVIRLGSFDHPAGARGNGVLKEGQLMVSCGTSWVCFFPCADRQLLLDQKALVDPFYSADGGLYAGLVSVGQAAIFVDKLVTKYISDADDRHIAYDRASEAAKPGADGLRIHPSVDYDKDFSAYSKENIARAVMEGTVYDLKAKLQPLEDAGLKFDSIVMAGGPSNSRIWRQITEEIMGIPVTVKYGAYSGAAGAAKVALGLIK